MIIDILITTYMMLSCFLTGMQFREYLDESRSNYDSKWLIFLVTFIILYICPLLYIIIFLIPYYNILKIKCKNWHHYLFKFDEKLNKEIIYLTIRDKHLPKSKGLDKVLLKLVIKKYEKLNNIKTPT